MSTIPQYFGTEPPFGRLPACEDPDFDVLQMSGPFPRVGPIERRPSGLYTPVSSQASKASQPVQPLPTVHETGATEVAVEATPTVERPVVRFPQDSPLQKLHMAHDTHRLQYQRHPP